MGSDGTTSRRRVCLWAGLALALWGLLANNITIAGDYTFWILSALLASVGALIAFGYGWPRFSWLGRTVALIVALPTGWTILDAGCRRLPALFGW